MRSFTLVAVLVALFFSTNFSQNFVEDQITFSGGEINHQLNLWVSGDFGSGFGWFGWSLNSQYWSEAYAGLTYSPFEWIQFGLGYGLETDDNPNRFGGFVWLGYDNLSYIGFFEDGGSGYWSRMIVNYAIDDCGLGIMYETLPGFGDRVGPRIEFTYEMFRIWGASMGNDIQMVGINFLF